MEQLNVEKPISNLKGGRNIQRVILKEKLFKLEEQNKESEDPKSDSELLGRLVEEFSSQEAFTLEDINDALSKRSDKRDLLDDLSPYVDRGYLDYNEETKEYSITDKAIEKYEGLDS